ncbi:secreted protein [gut metagenome]|uniref:Secreted protein n=1 Tax=gut metagenome TaxID=749906 RepID=J9GRA4_9ZZZZ
MLRRNPVRTSSTSCVMTWATVTWVATASLIFKHPIWTTWPARECASHRHMPAVR